MKLLRRSAASVVAMCVLMAFAGTGSAAAFTSFNSEKSPVKIFGVQIEAVKLRFKFGEFSCKSATFEGASAVRKTSTVVVTPTYANCNFLGLTENIRTNGCKYKFFAVGSVNVVCPSGQSIEINQPSFNCTVLIGSQSGLKLITYMNQGVGSSRSLRVTPSVSGIKYTQGKNCPGGTGTFTDGSYTKGAANVKGTFEGVQVGVFVS